MGIVSLKDYRWDGSKKLELKDAETGAPEFVDKKTLKAQTMENLAEAAALQDKLYAQGREGILIAIQARDAAGKDSLIKKVFGQLNPAALEVAAFKAPSKEELSHDYLWRIIRTVPPRVTDDPDFYPKRYQQIRNWEQYLYENGYRVVKVYLNVSCDEQKRRFLDRLEREDKHWKLSVDDMRERRLWKQYDEAFEDAINATATKESPWYVLPADDKWFTRYLMSEILLDVLMDVNPDYPPLDPAEAAKVPAILAELENGE